MHSTLKLAKYIKMGRLLHFVTITELVILYMAFNILHLGAWMAESETALRFFILLPLLWSPIFPQLDARCRLQDYKMMKDYFYLHGFDVRLVKHFAKSRCQRDAIALAAEEMGYGKQCTAYFNQCGYKWYHLLPDIIFEKPTTLFSWSFYRKTFFAKTYHSKISCIELPVKTVALPVLNIKAG